MNSHRVLWYYHTRANLLQTQAQAGTGTQKNIQLTPQQEKKFRNPGAAAAAVGSCSFVILQDYSRPVVRHRRESGQFDD